MQLTRFILCALSAAGQLGLTVETILREARAELQRDLTLPELETEIRTLADKSLLTIYTPTLGSKRWRITQLGTSVVKEEGLA